MIGVVESKFMPVKGTLVNTEGLLHYFKLEESSGNFKDTWGGLSGVMTGDYSRVVGKKGNGLRLLNQNSFMTVSGFSGITTKASVNYWIKLQDHTPPVVGATGWFRLNDSDLNAHYPYTDGKIYCSLLTSARKTIGAGIVADRRKWHMITITADTGINEWKFYQNAELVFTGTVGNLVMRPSLIFGKSHTGGGTNYYINGWLDEIQIKKTVMDQAEIEKNFNDGKGITL